ncbi:hypothetical protein ASE92_08070 [Pedobacter sp. Leaf41]|nr:hypothetical protein ASE92_08070 [Pedobacter sp. Leaf41]
MTNAISSDVLMKTEDIKNRKQPKSKSSAFKIINNVKRIIAAIAVNSPHIFDRLTIKGDSVLCIISFFKSTLKFKVCVQKNS